METGRVVEGFLSRVGRSALWTLGGPASIPGYTAIVTPDLDETRSAVLAATVTAAASIAFQVGAKATRDALFLSSFGIAALPAMVMATAILAIGFAFLSARALTAWGPGRVIPIAFGASAALLMIEWAISLWAARAAAVLVYLHCGCLGGLLISGFWSLLNERFDPRTAKHNLGAISAWGTVGGALGGLIAARVGQTLPVTAMLPILASFHFISAIAVARLKPSLNAIRRPAFERDAESMGRSMQSGLRAISGSGYLRGLVALVLLVTISEVFLDLMFKGRAAAALGEGGRLLRFFAVFYTVVSLFTLLVQALGSRFSLLKLGPAGSAAILPAGVAAAATGALVVPGLATAALARGSESALSNSLYRAGYEVLFTPVSAREKRAVKPLADVGAARVGDLIAGGIAQGVLLLSLAAAPFILTAMALAAAVLAILAAIRLHAGYVRTLERALRSRAVELDLSEVHDSVTQSILLKTMGIPKVSGYVPGSKGSAAAQPGRIDPRSRDPESARRMLGEGALPEALIPAAIPLLGWDDVARDAIEALRRAGPASIQPLVSALLDPREDFAIRRRIPLVLATYQDPRAVEGLARGLDDRRFEVRYRCGRGLSRLVERDPSLRVAPSVVYGAVLREVEAGAGVWEGRRLLDRFDDEAWSPAVDDVIRDRAHRSLEHVFTLLALVLPRQPLQIAFRGLHVSDAHLRGTALEYLESALPPEIRRPLWPYLEDRRPKGARAARPTEEALAELLRSSDSIAIHLRELRGAGEGDAHT